MLFAADATNAGTLGAVADGIGDPLDVYEKRLQTLKRTRLQKPLSD